MELTDGFEVGGAAPGTLAALQPIAHREFGIARLAIMIGEQLRPIGDDIGRIPLYDRGHFTVNPPAARLQQGLVGGVP